MCARQDEGYRTDFLHSTLINSGQLPLIHYQNLNSGTNEKHFCLTFNSTQSCPCDIALKRINCPIVGKLEEVRPMQKIQKRTGRRTFWCGKAPGVPEFSTLKKFWQKTLKRWSNVTSVSKKGTH